MPVERFKALFSSGKNKGKYRAVSRSSYDNDEPREAFVDDEVISLRRTVWHLAASLAIVISALFFTLAYIVANGSHNHDKCHGSAERVGSDPNRFVPPGKNPILINDGSASHLHGTEIGEPPRWTFLADASSPYYIEEDTFYDINKTIATVTRIKSIHNCKISISLFLSTPSWTNTTPPRVIDMPVLQLQTCLSTGTTQTGSTQMAMSPSFPPTILPSPTGRPTLSAGSTRCTVS